MITGYFVRAVREGRLQSLDIGELSDKELADFISTRPREEGFRWAESLAQWMRTFIALPVPKEGAGEEYTALYTFIQKPRYYLEYLSGEESWRLVRAMVWFIRDLTEDHHGYQVMDETPTYQRLKDLDTGKLAFRCKCCGMTSFNANDYEQAYCGNCHLFL